MGEGSEPADPTGTDNDGRPAELETLLAELVTDRRVLGGAGRRAGVERGARILLDRGVEPQFVLRDDEQTGPFVISQCYWSLRMAADPSMRTAAACGAWLLGHADESIRATIAQRWAWAFGVDNRHDVETPGDIAAAAIALADRDDRELAFACLVHAAKLWSNRHVVELRGFLNSSTVAAAGDGARTPLFEALRAAAAFADAPASSARAVALARSACDGGADTTTMRIIVEAVADSRSFPGQDELVMEFATAGVRAHPDDHQLLFGLASACWRCGDLDRAAQNLDAAMARLEPGEDPDEWLRIRSRYLAVGRAIARDQDVERRMAALERDLPVLREGLHELPALAWRRLSVPLAVLGLALAWMASRAPFTATAGFAARAESIAMLGGALIVFVGALWGGMWLLTRRRSGNPSRSR